MKTYKYPVSDVAWEWWLDGARRYGYVRGSTAKGMSGYVNAVFAVNHSGVHDWSDERDEYLQDDDEYRVGRGMCKRWYIVSENARIDRRLAIEQFTCGVMMEIVLTWGIGDVAKPYSCEPVRLMACVLEVVGLGMLKMRVDKVEPCRVWKGVTYKKHKEPFVSGWDM